MNAPPISLDRVVVLGVRGVIASALIRRLESEGIDIVACSSTDLDLTEETAADRLAGLLRESDSLVMVSGLTDQKGEPLSILQKNIQMAGTVCSALQRATCAHIVYVSSDAVYRYGDDTVTEETPAAPDRLYGTMHLLREQMIGQFCVDLPLSILRCSTVVSAGDTHNTYGPHRFVRQAREDGRIVLFGDGSETRDYIAIEDVARLIFGALAARYDGVLNMATGQSTSFREVAEIVAGNFDGKIEIVQEARRVPVTHRKFDVARLHSCFPEFRFTPLETAVTALCRDNGLRPVDHC